MLEKEAEGQYMSTNKQVNEPKTKLIRIDAGLHRLAKIESARTGETLKSLVEGALADILGPKNSEDRK